MSKKLSGCGLSAGIKSHTQPPLCATASCATISIYNAIKKYHRFLQTQNFCVWEFLMQGITYSGFILCFFQKMECISFGSFLSSKGVHAYLMSERAQHF